MVKKVNPTSLRPNVATFQRHNVPTSQRSNVTTSQRHDVAGKSKQTLSLREAIKGRGESNYKGSKFVFIDRVWGIGAWNKGKKT